MNEHCTRWVDHPKDPTEVHSIAEHRSGMEPRQSFPTPESPLISKVLGELRRGNPITGFETLARPFYRRTFSSLIANELVAVQPMSLSSGLLFYMDYRYESKGDQDPNRSFIRNPGPSDSFCIKPVSPIITVDYSRFPHLCPRCRAPAYIGFTTVECSREGCR